MSNDIKQVIGQCKACQLLRPSQPSNMLTPTTLTKENYFTLQEVASDLFSLDGDEFLILVDRHSGYICCEQLRNTITSEVTKTLSTWFNMLGWPETIRTDGGPQYRSEFDQFCSQYHINHELTSPYNSQANGLAEAAVKNAKTLLRKCKITGEDFQYALAAWRNLPRADGFSPAEMLFKSKQKIAVLLPPWKTNIEPDTEAKNEHMKRNFDQANKKNKQYSILDIGTHVLMQHHLTKKWDQYATIKEIRDDKL